MLIGKFEADYRLWC